MICACTDKVNSSFDAVIPVVQVVLFLVINTTISMHGYMEWEVRVNAAELSSIKSCAAHRAYALNWRDNMLVMSLTLLSLMSKASTLLLVKDQELASDWYNAELVTNRNQARVAAGNSNLYVCSCFWKNINNLASQRQNTNSVKQQMPDWMVTNTNLGMQISAEDLVWSKNINSHVCVVNQSSCKLIDSYL